MNRLLDEGLGRESGAFAMTARAKDFGSTRMCHWAKNKWTAGSSVKDAHRMHSNGSRPVYSQGAASG